MKQLTIGDILSLIKALQNEGMNIKEICSLSKSKAAKRFLSINTTRKVI